jgi:hypothetical protein
VVKSGYVQKELRIALAAYSERPADAIFLIPLRLDECEIPEIDFPETGVRLRDLQWLDYWRDDALKRLLHALKLAGCVPTTSELPTDLCRVFLFGDYLLQLLDRAMPPTSRRRLFDEMQSLPGIPVLWRRDILTRYVATFDLRETLDSLAHNLPRRMENVLLLGLFFRSLDNAAQQYPNEDVEGGFRKNVAQVLEQLRAVEAPAAVQEELASVLKDAEFRLVGAERAELLSALSGIVGQRILPWLGSLPCE